MSDLASSAELIEKIKKDMLNSGFPLEFHVLNVCSTKNTGRMPGLKYEFLGQQRELDLLAFFEELTLGPKKDPTLQHTSTDLVIECKKRADKPWVFMSSSSYYFQSETIHLKYMSEYDLYFAHEQKSSLFSQILPRLRKNHYSDKTMPRCTSYYEAFKDPNQPSDIYKAIDTVVSYVSYRRAERIKIAEMFGTFSEFYLPIIVLDGKLFEASISQDTITVLERPHIQLRTFHRDDIYIIDVVTKDYFPHYFDMVEAFHLEIVSAIRKLNFPADFRSVAWSKLRAIWTAKD